MKVGGYLPDYDYRKYDANGDIIAGSEKIYSTPNLLLEPQVLFRIGGEDFKFNVKVGFAWLSDLYGGSSNTVPFTADLFTLSTGFTFAF